MRLKLSTILSVGIPVSVLVILQIIARPSPVSFESIPGEGKQLVVITPGLARNSLKPLIAITRETFPEADILAIRYDNRLYSNADLYGIASQLETKIDVDNRAKEYESIVLVGHSLGAMIVRKALLWGYGLEQDRVAQKGKHEWVDKVERIVSLAGTNRGWSVDPKPSQMTLVRYAAIKVGVPLGRLTGTCRLVLAAERGAPFIADLRIQWIQFVRGQSSISLGHIPQVIHLLGDEDDIVSREDAMDLGAAKDITFVTLTGTNHQDIATAIMDARGKTEQERRTAVKHALLGEVEKLSRDKEQDLEENLEVSRVIYLMHGIRDYGLWTDQVRKAIESRVASNRSVAVINNKYGYFPMLPFLLYWDRQKNVRRFMDEYTQDVARFPRAQRFDFAGHSNGTYILASALQRYKTLRIGRVFFAGSVVPKHYPWRQLLDEGRVERVINVVATDDWVVAIFPKVFEQIADWLNKKPTTGLLDLGAAGFRGFQAAEDPSGLVMNLQFTKGSHGTGVDTANPEKIEAIIHYILDGPDSTLSVFEDASIQSRSLEVISNICLVVWIMIFAMIVGLALVAFRWHWAAGVGFLVALAFLLVSI